MELEHIRHIKEDNRQEAKNPDLAMRAQLTPDTIRSYLDSSARNHLRPDNGIIDFAVPDIYAGQGKSVFARRDIDSTRAMPKLELALENSYLEKSAEAVSVGDISAGKIRPHLAPESKDHRATMIGNAEINIKNPRHLARFKESVDYFEKRAISDNISPGAVSKTYENINRLLVGNKDSPISPKLQVQLALNVMRQAANPSLIDQGGNNTCNVTTLENMLYSKEPQEAARLVADVGTTGSFVARDGTKVVLDKNSMIPDKESRPVTPVDETRSYATQLFNVTAVNLHYQKNSPQLRYENHPIRGERLMDTSKSKAEVARNNCGTIKEPNLTDDQIIGIYSSLTNSDGKDVLFTHRDYNDATRSTVFSSETELSTKLLELKQNGKLPVILSVNTAVEPFFTESGGGNPKGYEGAHVLVVRDIAPGPPPRVAVDNQYGRAADHLGDKMMSLRSLYLATLPTPKAIEHLKAEIANDKAQGIGDRKKANELRRLLAFTPSKDCG